MKVFRILFLNLMENLMKFFNFIRQIHSFDDKNLSNSKHRNKIEFKQMWNLCFSSGLFEQTVCEAFQSVYFTQVSLFCHPLPTRDLLFTFSDGHVNIFLPWSTTNQVQMQFFKLFAQNIWKTDVIHKHPLFHYRV